MIRSEIRWCQNKGIFNNSENKFYHLIDKVEHTISYDLRRYNAIPYNIMQYHSISYNTMQWHAIPCNTMKYHTIICYTNIIGSRLGRITEKRPFLHFAKKRKTGFSKKDTLNWLKRLISIGERGTFYFALLCPVVARTWLQ